MLKNKYETKQIIAEWRKVLNEGLYDQDPELLEEGLKEKLAGGLAALMFVAGGSGVKDASAYPPGTNHIKAAQTVQSDLAERFDEEFKTINEKYPGVDKKIAADKTLEAIDYMFNAAMKSGDFEILAVFEKLYRELKPLIEKKTVRGEVIYYLPMSHFDSYARNPEFEEIFNRAAKAAAESTMSENPTSTRGAKLIHNTRISN